MTGGSGNDVLASQRTSDGPGIMTDFNNLTEHDHIAICASGFGGGLTAGMDATSVFESSADDQSRGSVPYSTSIPRTSCISAPNGTQASVIMVAQVQAGVTINPHDLLIV